MSFDLIWSLQMIQVGAQYRHYKGDLYEVIEVAKCTETFKDFVVYKCLYENSMAKIWIRPLSMFTEEIEINGQMVSRFELVTSP